MGHTYFVEKVYSYVIMINLKVSQLQVGCDMLWWWWSTWKFYMVSTCLNNHYMWVGRRWHCRWQGKDGRAREVADIRMYHFRWNFLPLGCDKVICCGDDGWVVSVDCETVSFAPNRVHWVLDDSLFSTLTIDIHFSLRSADWNQFWAPDGKKSK